MVYSKGATLLRRRTYHRNIIFSRQEEDPWIELRLERNVYIHEITMITKNAIPVAVKTTNNETGQTGYCRVTMDTGSKQTAKCSIESKTNIIRIGVLGVNRSLSLCWLQLAAFGNDNSSCSMLHFYPFSYFLTINHNYYPRCSIFQ